MTERKEPLLLREKVYCECGEKVTVVKTPFIAHTVAITGVCFGCKRLFTGDGEPEFKDGKPLYYTGDIKDYGIRIEEMEGRK